ncbi:class E basic helix-loop-helix protein 41 [Ambystoma mexicanum]|uniref:class E basic helix-loop-helix protein 41 n=1 Tax=Ambystoma mexicanum TaxID=8296 RepID=UPI0037E8FE26
MCAAPGSPPKTSSPAPCATSRRLDMEEGLRHLQPRPLLEARDFIGVDYSSLYICKSKRGTKREERQETYKLPHRLIEKKRRDRINECIAQLKDLLPEHLKLTTLGHLEKAVVLELTLKHLKALTALTEQQHQKIIALQNGEQVMPSPMKSDLDAFHSGFHTCAKEVLQYLSRFENWSSKEQRCSQLISHLHSSSSQFLPTPQLLAQQVTVNKGASSVQAMNSPKLENQTNCVPVIQRTHNAELNENDTDTDSGYGGEGEKNEGKAEGDSTMSKGNEGQNVTIKQEPMDDPPPKRFKTDCSSSALIGSDQAMRPDASVLSSLMGFGAAPFGQQTPFCLPFYFISPSAAAAYMPFLDKINLDKYLYPAAASLPFIYPALQAQAAAAAAVATFPCLSSVLTPEKVLLNHAVPSPTPSDFLTGSSSVSEAGLAKDIENPLQEVLQSAKESI